MTRVVILAPDDLPIPPQKGGSVQIYVHSLFSELTHHADPHGYQPYLISPGNKKMDGALHIPIQKIHLAYQREALKQLRKLHPDIVQIENRPAWVTRVKAALPGTKVVLNLHSLTFLMQSTISRPAAVSALKAADAVTFNSHSLRRQVAARFGLSKASWNPHVIYPGVESTRFSQTDVPKGQAVSRTHSAKTKTSPTKELRLLFVGRVIRQKGVHVLVEAVRELKRNRIPVRLTIIGRTHPWEKAYRIRLAQHAKGLPIRFVGFVIPPNLPPYYRNADVLVCPSQGHEAFGLVNLEAMSAGLPVVGSRQGGIAEIVNESSGVLVKNYKNAHSFALVLTELARDPARMSQLKEGALKRADEFTWNKCARRFFSVYKSLF